MDRIILLGIDIAAIGVLTFALYFPRHGRRDMVVAYLVANIGVSAAAVALSTSGFSAGLGLGLFGILSIIRLRSDVLDQPEVAYYFASLALGLLAGITVTPTLATLALMGLVLLALYIGDHPRLFARHRTHVVNLDVAIPDERALVRHLEQRLDATIGHVSIRKVDFVNDTTSVEVRYEQRAEDAPSAAGQFTWRAGGERS